MPMLMVGIHPKNLHATTRAYGTFCDPRISRYFQRVHNPHVLNSTRKPMRYPVRLFAAVNRRTQDAYLP